MSVAPVFGRYQVQGMLGTGAHGRVLKVLDLTANEQRTLKVLLDERGQESFFASFQALASIQNPHLVQLYDSGRDRSGLCYFTSEVLTGQVVEPQDHEHVDVVTLRRYLTEVLRGLDVLHQHGLVHGNLKLSNLFLADVPGASHKIVKLTDAGLNTDLRSPAARSMLPYLAPEQLEGRPADVRCDLYAVGAIFYDLFTGLHPFPGTRLEDLLQQKLHDRPAPLSSFRSDVPPGLDSVISSLLDPDPYQRPVSASQVLRQLESIEVGAMVDGDPTGQLRLTLVGRDRHLQGVDRAIEELKAGRGQVLLLTGAPGAGRTRLLREITARLRRANVPLHELRGDDSRETTPSLRSLVLTFARDERPQVRDIIQAHAASLLPFCPELSSVVALPHRPLGTLDPRGRGTPHALALSDDLASFCLEISTPGRALLVDDAHRTAAPLQRLFAQLALRRAEGSLLLVLALDPSALTEDSPLAEIASDPGHNRYELTGLNRTQLETLLAEAVGRPRGWQLLVEGVERAAGGNPALIEQALRLLVQGDALSFHRGAWRIQERQMAPILVGMVPGPEHLATARLVGVRSAERRLLQIMATLGSTSLEELGVALGPSVTPQQLESMLAHLRRQGLAAAGDEGRRWMLGHPSMRVVLVAQIDPADRMAWHRKVAEWIEGKREGGAPAERLAYHWLEAGEVHRALAAGLKTLDTLESTWRLEDALDLAWRLTEVEIPSEEELLRLCERTCRLAMGVGDLRRAAALSPRLEELGAAEGRMRIRWRIFRLLGQICLRGGQYEEARRHLQSATEVVPDTVPISDRLALTVEYILVRMLTGKAETAERLLASTLETVPAPDDTATMRHLVSLWALRVNVASILGRLPEAEHQAHKGFQAVQAFASRVPSGGDLIRADSAQLHLHAASAAYYQGKYQEAVQHSREALIRFEEQSDLAYMSQCHFLAGSSYRAVGDFRSASLYFEKMREIARRGRSWVDQCNADNQLGVLHRIAGRFDRAQLLLEEGQVLARSLKNNRMSGVIAGNLGEVFHRRGNFEQAQKLYDEAITTLKFTGKADLPENIRRTVELALDQDNLRGFEPRVAEALALVRAESRADEEVYLLALLGVYTARMGRTREAVGHFRAGEELLGQLASPYIEGRLRLYQGRAYLDMGMFVDAEAALRSAEKIFSGLGASLDLTRVQEALRTLEESAQGQTQANKRLEQLLQINRTLNSELDLTRLLDLIVEQAIQISRGERGFIILFDEQGKPSLHTSRSMGREEVSGKASQLSLTVLKRVITSMQPVTITNVERDMELRSQKSVVSLGLRSILCLPIKRGTRLLGVLYVDSSMPIEDFFQRDQSLLEALVDGAAVALENAQLVTSLRRKTDLMSILAHEFRSPVTATLLFTRHVLRQSNVLGEDLKEALTGIEAQSLRLSRMIGNILDLARLEARQVDWSMGPVAIGDVIQATSRGLSPIAREAGIVLAQRVESPGLTVWGDADRLIQVTTNLLANSLKFSPEGGIIVLGARVLAEPAAGASIQPVDREHWAADRLPAGKQVADGRCVVVEVIDSGPGIPQEDLDRIFERFAQTGSREQKAHGSGLGLTISKEIVRQHGGRIWAENLKEGGAAFRFTLPLLVDSR